MADLHRMIARFPLVARPRPLCSPLPDRLRDLSNLATKATGQESSERAATIAAVHNKAALIASDVGMPDLAREFCWRHFDLYQDSRPLPAQQSRYALEPVVNLARLRIRAGDGKTAHLLLDGLYHSVTSGTELVIEGRRLSFAGFTDSAKARETVRGWLWTVLLGDGTRALSSAGLWEEALAHVECHRGVGDRLLDGRQVLIVARCLAGEHEEALRLVQQSAVGEPWEHPVAACLAALCLRFGGVEPPASSLVRRYVAYLDADRQPGLAVFRARLGLTALDVLTGRACREVQTLAARVIYDGVASGDSTVARDLLTHETLAQVMSDTDRSALQRAADGRKPLTDVRDGIEQALHNMIVAMMARPAAMKQ